MAEHSFCTILVPPLTSDLRSRLSLSLFDPPGRGTHWTLALEVLLPDPAYIPYGDWQLGRDFFPFSCKLETPGLPWLNSESSLRLDRTLTTSPGLSTP